MSLVLPQSTVRLIETVPNNLRHPGLQLDKFSVAGDQAAQKTALTKVCNIGGDPALLTALLERRKRVLDALPGATSVRCTTIGPLTLHLARASALENAGICLHPIYGFAYLPGSGLKGTARAYAETVWLPTQTDQKKAWRQIGDVFGWAENPDRLKQIKDPAHPAQVRRQDDNDPGSPEIRASSGNIVFHDAWPDSWPQLIVDIVNNHHPEYYQAGPDDNDHPPGDWENPVPVYFLAVKPGTTFTFPLATRRDDVADELLDLARQWLLGALCHLGAGAKTAAGYGAFQPADPLDPATQDALRSTWQAVQTGASPKRAVFETTLELVTPAFLAGANQQADDCDLRPATLRGLLRWWWRTMHAGYLDVKTLRALEAAIWGDTHGSGAVRIVIEKASGENPRLFDKRSKANFDNEQKRSEYGIPAADPRKITQGLWYASYGMDQANRRRYYLEPGARWRLRLIARPTPFSANRKDATEGGKANSVKRITAEHALHQASTALWLLCHFGGVGSKSRKGFGSLRADGLQDQSVQACREAARSLRVELGLSRNFDEHDAHSPSLEQMLGPIEVDFSWPNVWSVLDQLGFAYESAAHQRAHDRSKVALGLPRQIHGPRNQPLPHQNPATHRRPERLGGRKGDRHSSPLHLHVERRDGGWTARVIAFPAAYLPNLETSGKFLKDFLNEFGGDLRRRAALDPPPMPSGSIASPRPSAASSGSVAGAVPVRVKFLGPHDKLKNAYWVQQEGKRRGLLKYGTPPQPLPSIGSEIEVYPTNDNPNSPEYRWDRPSAEGPPRRGPGPRPPRRR